MAETHHCPGGCGQQVRNRLFACRADWFRLPADIRARINNAYDKHGVGSDELIEAHSQAIRWYAEN